MRAAVVTRSRAVAVARRWWIVAPTLLAGALVLLARQCPNATERLYSSGAYRVLAGAFGRLTSLFPYSLMELLLCGTIVVAVMLIVRAVRQGLRTVRGQRIPWDKAGTLKALGQTARMLCLAFCVFIFLCGLNYYRPEFTTFSGLTVRASSAQELSALCMSLTQEANALRTQVSVDENGVTALTGGAFATAHDARDAFAGLAADYDVLPDLGIVPKPVINSWWMSMTQITGVFSPFTYEANVNIAAPDYSVPATMCHELAHTRGFMREDEANFIGYLACRKSDSAAFQYSGVMLALVHSLNRLYTVDRAATDAVNALMSAEVHRDFAANSAYWDRFEGPVAEVSTAVNNTYLRVNNQQDGVQSYGRMVDLLLAERRHPAPAGAN